MELSCGVNDDTQYVPVYVWQAYAAEQSPALCRPTINQQRKWPYGQGVWFQLCRKPFLLHPDVNEQKISGDTMLELFIPEFQRRKQLHSGAQHRTWCPTSLHPARTAQIALANLEGRCLVVVEPCKCQPETRNDIEQVRRQVVPKQLVSWCWFQTCQVVLAVIKDKVCKRVTLARG